MSIVSLLVLLLISFVAAQFEIKPPEEVTAYPGQNVTLPCVIANNYTDQTVIWFSIRTNNNNKKELITQDRERIIQILDNLQFSILGEDNNFTLHIVIPESNKIDFKDDDTITKLFQCSVTSKQNENMIFRAMSKVTINQSTFNKPICLLNETVYTSGQTLTFGCFADSNSDIQTNLKSGKGKILPSYVESSTFYHTSIVTKEKNTLIYICESKHIGTNETKSCSVGPITVNQKPTNNDNGSNGANTSIIIIVIVLLTFCVLAIITFIFCLKRKRNKAAMSKINSKNDGTKTVGYKVTEDVSQVDYQEIGEQFYQNESKISNNVEPKFDDSEYQCIDNDDEIYSEPITNANEEHIQNKVHVYSKVNKPDFKECENEIYEGPTGGDDSKNDIHEGATGGADFKNEIHEGPTGGDDSKNEIHEDATGGADFKNEIHEGATGGADFKNEIHEGATGGADSKNEIHEGANEGMDYKEEGVQDEAHLYFVLNKLDNKECENEHQGP